MPSGIFCLLVFLFACTGAIAGPAVDLIDAALLLDPPYQDEYPASVVELQIPSNGALLPGHIYLAAGPGPHPTVVLLHGLPGNERNLDIAQAMRRLGFNTLFFHYRGAWGAGGEYRFRHLPEDTLAVLAYLRDTSRARALRVDSATLSVLGHSLGGYTALAVGARDQELSCVMALSPANLGVWKAGLSKEGDANMARLSAYADTLFMLKGMSGQVMVDELRETPMAALDTAGFGPGLSNKPVLMIVGEEDSVTPAASMFDPVVEAYRLDGVERLRALKLSGDHSFSWSRIALTREILSWSDANCR
ncbi:MAG: pimeloyl-ACP methyl ester carboxylesterase [Halieaceae bacterium]|jgi:pimeloyl-ACP methyl ester carboxylesterase